MMNLTADEIAEVERLLDCAVASGRFVRRDFEKALAARSVRLRRPDESIAQATTRTVIDDPVGRLLFKAASRRETGQRARVPKGHSI
jgi:hypothetical protein